MDSERTLYREAALGEKTHGAWSCKCLSKILVVAILKHRHLNCTNSKIRLTFSSSVDFFT